MNGSNKRKHNISTPSIMQSDIDNIEKQLRSMNATFEHFMERVDKSLDERMEIEEDLKILLILLKGNKMNSSDKGLIGVINDISNRLLKLEQLKNKFIWWIAGFGVGFGSIFTLTVLKLVKAI
jgi:hypothetical protein